MLLGFVHCEAKIGRQILSVQLEHGEDHAQEIIQRLDEAYVFKIADEFGIRL